MNIGTVCQRNVITVEKDLPIRDAAILMREQHVGDVVVVKPDGDRIVPVGILTDRDIVLELVAENVEIDSVLVGDVVSAELLQAAESDSIDDTLTRMRNKGVRRVPVLSVSGSLVGVLAMDDIIDSVAEQMIDLAGLIATERAAEEEHRSASISGL